MSTALPTSVSDCGVLDAVTLQALGGMLLATELNELAERNGAATVIGVGDERLRAKGVACLDADELATMQADKDKAASGEIVMLSPFLEGWLTFGDDDQPLRLGQGHLAGRDHDDPIGNPGQ